MDSYTLNEKTRPAINDLLGRMSGVSDRSQRKTIAESLTRDILGINEHDQKTNYWSRMTVDFLSGIIMYVTDEGGVKCNIRYIVSLVNDIESVGNIRVILPETYFYKYIGMTFYQLSPTTQGEIIRNLTEYLEDVDN